MNISERQFQYLKTMGVSLWQSRPEFFHDGNLAQVENETVQVSVEAKVVEDKATNEATVRVEKESKNTHGFNNIEQFLAHPLSADILIALNCDKSNALLTETGVQLDGLLWLFNSDDKCDYGKTILNTPSLDQLAKDKNLKAELWVCLCNHINN